MTYRLFIAIPKITPPETVAAMRKAATAVGFEPVFAADVEPKNPRGTPNERSEARFRAVCAAMKQCDALMANLTPFLGVEPDADVVFQLGYMAAQQKPSFSYTNVSKPYYERVKEWNGGEFTTEMVLGKTDHVARIARDRDGLSIENMGIQDRSVHLFEEGHPDSYTSVMLEGPSMQSGTKVMTPSLARTHVAGESLYSDLSVFAKSLATARQHLLVQGNGKTLPSPMVPEDSSAAYLGGPDISLPDAVQQVAHKKTLLAPYGLHGAARTDVPMDVGFMQSWARGNGNNPRMRKNLYMADLAVMQSARCGIFNLTPCHGVAPDSGTIFAMGYMTGKDDQLGRRPMVFGYSNDPNTLQARISLWEGNPQGPEYGAAHAADAFGPDAVYSPMIDGAILVSGGTLANHLGHAAITDLAPSGEARYSYAGQFQHAAREAGKMARVSQILQHAGGRSSSAA